MLGQSEKIYARDTKTIEITKEEAIKFLNKNHLQGGYNRIKKAFGLIKDNKIVSVMTFDQQEGRKKMEDIDWNLSRFCNKKGYTIVGGASKLLKGFEKTYKPTRIVSYADADWSTGGLYKTLGFEQVSWSKPDYKYVVGDERQHKSGWRKPKGYPLTEKQIMQELEIPRIWDCGKIKYQKK